MATLYQHIRVLRAGQTLPQDSAELNLVMAVFSDIRLLDVTSLCNRIAKAGGTRLASRMRQIIRSMNELSSMLLSHVSHPRACGAADGRLDAMIYRIVHNTTYLYATAAEACHN